ncbi:hypothetical protein L2Y90_05745 [Burkholderia pyrrocinia]|uniref:hypothetical protein n=1 Tax=Burkholderia pyrrocinia TaxID=60550 RepID=UPI00215A7406|nr:hypothetical protein [Burkholderia pyrrocinia]UVE66624.1 hypothetical protein L2Y90_05745 [Burkholderia pyrrocinia]
MKSPLQRAFSFPDEPPIASLHRTTRHMLETITRMVSRPDELTEIALSHFRPRFKPVVFLTALKRAFTPIASSIMVSGLLL